MTPVRGGRARPGLPWWLRLVLARWRPQSRLHSALLAVAVVASSALCALVPLVVDVEPAAVRAAIGDLPPARTAIVVQVVRPGSAPEALRTDAGAALARLLGSRTPPPSEVDALSQQLATTLAGDPVKAFVAAVDEPSAAAVLVSGSWPGAGSHDVAVPETAARALGLVRGDRLPLAAGDDAAATPLPGLRVSGVYRPRPDAPLWQLDPLHADGEDPAFVDPDLPNSAPGQAIGPLLAARGAFSTAVPLRVVALRFAPDLTGTGPSRLRSTAAAVHGATSAVVAGIGSGSLSVDATSEAPSALGDLADGLAATRALVAVGGGLLAVLTIAVLLTIARLLAAGRAGEQRLLTERGAGRGRLLGLATGEAIVAGLVVAITAPLLAAASYPLLTASAAARAAGVPATAAVSSPVVAVAAACGLALVVILVATAMRPPARDRSARGARLSSVARSGADVAVLLLALLLLQRMLASPGPPAGPALAGPALLLVAAALIGVRLVALVGRALEPVAVRLRSAVAAVAAFELGRRPQRSAAAVLVVALGVGAGAFAVAQLRTWDRSQHDQAAFAVGAPARAAASGRTAVPSSAVLAADPRAALVVRADALLTGGNDATGVSTSAPEVLGLPARARALLRGGGAAGALIRAALPVAAPSAEIALPADARRLRVEFPAAGPALPRPAGVRVTVLLRDADGLVVGSAPRTLGTGAAALRFPLPASGALRLVGLGAMLPSDGTRDGIRLRLTAVTAEGAGPDRELAPPQGWSAVGTDGQDVALETGARRFAELTAPSAEDDATPVVVRLLAWRPAGALPVVLDRTAARGAALLPREEGRLLVAGVAVPVAVAGVVGRAPASVPAADLASGGGIARTSVVLADREELQRALVQRGALLSDETRERWFVPAAGRALTAGAVDADRLASALHDDPVSVPVLPALLLLIGTAALLTVAAFAVQTASARSERRFDTAQLRAAGATPWELARLEAAVAAVLVVLGTAVGLAAGAAVAASAAPRLVTGPDGAAPVPAVRFDAALPVVLPAGGAAALLLVGLVAGTALLADRGSTARLIRSGGEP